MKSTVLSLIIFFALLFPGLAQTDPTSKKLYRTFKQVSAPGDGAMWGLTNEDEIYKWTGVDWALVEGALSQISVGSRTDVWGVNAENMVWQATIDGWVRRPGRMRQVAVSKTLKGGAAPAAVVAIDLDGKPFTWDGVSNWQPFPNAPTLAAIAIGRSHQIYGIGTKDEIYRWRPTSSTWFRLNGSLRKISIAADGSVGGVNAEKIGFLRSDSDVEAEVSGATTEAKWEALPVTIDGLEILDAKTAIATDSEGLRIQLGGPGTNGIITLDDSKLVVTGSLFDPPIVTGSNTRLQFNNGCVRLNGTLRLEGQNSPIDLKEFKCSSFSDIAVPNPPITNSGAVFTVRPVTYGDDIPGGREDLGKNSDHGGGARYETGLPYRCAARSFHNMSHHSFVEFQMPQGQQGELIMIPGGAYNKYVVPACNRVWWTDLVFACTIPPGSNNWQWTLLAGKYDADAGCTGNTPPKRFFTYGDF